MAIDYNEERWTALREQYAAWRKNDEGAPILGWITQRDPGRPVPNAPILEQGNCTDFSWTPDQLADRMFYEMECLQFYGAAYPRFNMHAFGPGVVAAFCGADIEISSTNNVWFKAPKKDIADIHIQFDEDSKWFRRVYDIYEACMKRFEGNAVLSMTDLGGAADIVATFVGSQDLLFALYDEPVEVKRLMNEAHEAWWQAYNKLNEVMVRGGAPGYSDWFGLYYPEPGGYILQSDFCYMIGPDMFREFIMPELAKSAEKLKWPVYHWDGPGELVHYDALMEIEPKLQAIQWVPGDGNPPQYEWPEVLSKIGSAGRKLLIYDGGMDELEKITQLPGIKKGQIYHQSFNVNGVEFGKW